MRDAAKAVAFKEALEPEFAQYAKQTIINAKVLCDELQKNGFKIMFGGTQNHLMLVDVFSSKGVTGHKAETILDNAGITLNKNMIPNDPRPPLDPSGIRLGTPAITTRGMKEPEMRWIAQAITNVLTEPDNISMHLSIREEVKNLAQKYPIYPELTYA